MKKILFPILLISTALALLVRLAYLQLFAHSETKIDDDLAISAEYHYPNRGDIRDRNQKLLVSNQTAYDLMVVPNRVKNLDTLELCHFLQISKEMFIEKMEKIKRYSRYKPSVFMGQISKEMFAPLQEKLRKYEGFSVQKRMQRYYHTDCGANILGYVSEVSAWELQEKKDYLAGELIGKQGVEKQYEEYLRGKKGVRYLQKDKYNRVIASYKDGVYDTLPVVGKDLELTIDEELQKYGELLMQNKRGGIVAIEPKTGEILALISAPSYNPNLLVGRKRSENYMRLHLDSLAKPLFDRSLQAEYPPGSTLKPLTALIALQEGVMTPKTLVPCFGSYAYGRRTMRCHPHNPPFDMVNAIATSCNSYFAHHYKKTLDKYPTPSEGLEAWSNHLKSFGLGNYLGSDFPIGKKGLIPDSEFYNRYYGKNRWGATFHISNAIGQGEILVTPLQLANVMAAIANRGYFFTPHIVRKIDGKPTPLTQYLTPKYTTIDKKHFTEVIRGMNLTYTKGTASALQIPNISLAAKTGTAENFIRIDGKRMQLTDHSIFVAFAPVEDPKIAIVVFVENGYFGARIAGPISSLMIEKYINGNIQRPELEKRMIEKSLEDEYAKPYKGVPFLINQ